MHFRFARHTANIKELEKFYTSILGFTKLGDFTNHDGYDGIFFGEKDADWHIEFTQNGESPHQKWDEDDVLVFYPTTQSSYDLILDNVKQAQLKIEESKNPYWNINGVQFSDPDGYRIIISPLKIKG